MGSSFVEYKGHGFWARDPFVEGWLQRLVREIDLVATPDQWLVAARGYWVERATGGFNGCVDCGFDDLLTDAAREVFLLELATRVPGQPGMTAGEAATAELFVKLLRGELATTAASPRDYLARD
jgi:biotin carboxylase